MRGTFPPPPMVKIILSLRSAFCKERFLDLHGWNFILAQEMSSFEESRRAQGYPQQASDVIHIASQRRKSATCRQVVGGIRLPALDGMTSKAATNRIGEMEHPVAIPTSSCCQQEVMF